MCSRAHVVLSKVCSELCTIKANQKTLVRLCAAQPGVVFAVDLLSWCCCCRRILLELPRSVSDVALGDQHLARATLVGNRSNE